VPERDRRVAVDFGAVRERAAPSLPSPRHHGRDSLGGMDVATGKPLSSLVGNTGKLSANGGKVVLTAAAARTVVDSVINTKGVIEANAIGSKGGTIVLAAATGSRKPAGPKQTIKSRLYFESDPDDADLRTLSTKKMNYGPCNTSIQVRWVNGVFIPATADVAIDSMVAAGNVVYTFVYTFVVTGAETLSFVITFHRGRTAGRN